jgi:tetratricopeptide (TPR) repeat protein
MKRLFVLVAACVAMPAFLLYAESPVPGKAVNKAAAVRSLEKAASLLAASAWSDAEFEAKLGESYDPSLADFSYITALSLAARNAPRADILAATERSLASGLFWRSYDRDEAAVLCARLYAETLRYTDALELLSTVKTHTSADEDYTRVYALYGQGKIPEARKAVQAALTRWPFDSRFPRVFLEREADHATSPEAIAIASSVVSRLYLWQDQDRSLLLLAVPFETDPATRERNIRVYRSMGKNDDSGAPQTADPLSAPLALEYGVIGEKDAVEEVFSTARTGISIDALHRLCNLVGLAGVRKDIASRLLAYDGIIEIDTSGDRAVDARIQYRLGRPVLAVFDRNQDGYADLTVNCDFGAPSRILGLNGDPDVVYDAYPFVRTVKSGSREYTLMPVKLGWSPVVWRREDLNLDKADFYTIRLTGKEPALTDRLLVNVSSFWKESDPSRASGEIRVTLENGVPVSSEATANGTKYAWTSYKKGLPTLTKEDRDGDSYFETTTAYAASGDRATVSVDKNANRAIEYRELYAADGSETIEWDTDEDGSIDLTWKRSGLGVETTTWLRTASGRIVTCITENGKPRSVSVGGETLSILKDPLTDIWWIGRIPPESIAISKKVEELFNAEASPVVSFALTIGRRKVEALRTGGMIFAELLNE